jgi:hypothetical protein
MTAGVVKRPLRNAMIFRVRIRRSFSNLQRRPHNTDFLHRALRRFHTSCLHLPPSVDFVSGRMP